MMLALFSWQIHMTSLRPVVEQAVPVVDFGSLQIHPSELKPAVTDALNAILQPVRDHFAKGDAKKLLDTVRKFKVTR